MRPVPGASYSVYTHDGNWSVNVPAPNGATTYEFVSCTYGPDGSKYSVFQSCSS